MPGTLQVCPHVCACVFVPRACTDRAPVASVAARKVSAKSFFMDCSFHELLYDPQKSLRIAPFYICAKSLQPPSYVFYRCEHRNGNQRAQIFEQATGATPF